MKNILATILLLIVLDSNAQSQADTTLRNLSVFFDSTYSNSSIHVGGLIKNIDVVKGLTITLSPSQGTPLINDTIFVIGNHGSYYTSWNKNIKPCMGYTISNQRILPTNISGALNCFISVVYKNGSMGTGKMYSVTRKP